MPAFSIGSPLSKLDTIAAETQASEGWKWAQAHLTTRTLMLHFGTALGQTSPFQGNSGEVRNGSNILIPG